MGDFFQNGVITTLHRLGSQPVEAIEARLREHAVAHPIALILPCLITELEGPAMGPIVRELAEVDYVGEIVVALGRADARQFQRAREFFRPLGPRCRIVWIEGARVQADDTGPAEEPAAGVVQEEQFREEPHEQVLEVGGALDADRQPFASGHALEVEDHAGFRDGDKQFKKAIHDC